MLLGFLAQSQNRSEDLLTFSWGIPGCDDARYAAESARLAGAQHHFFELKPDWLSSMAEESVRICDGMGNIVNMHALATVDRQVELAQVLFKGFLGDAMFGFGIRPRYWAQYSTEDRVQAHLDAYRDYDVLTFDLPVHEKVFTETFNTRIAGGIIADYQSVMDSSQQEDLADQRIYIDLTQRVPRMTLNGVEAIRSQAAVRLPFADNDLIEFSLGLVPGLRLGRSVMVQAFIQALPEYAQIPLASTGLPLTSCAREVALRAAKLVRWHLRSRGLGWMAGPERRPYKDYDAWFRTVLRDRVEDVLLSDSSLARGILKPEMLRKTVEDHMSGSNHAVKLGALLSVEIWHRMYLD
jgi:asparagine synthase (glutamine-hydrolysing)